MESLSMGETVAVVVAAILALCGAISTIGSAVERLVKTWRAAKAPNDRQDARLHELEKWREEVDRKLNNDHDELVEIHKALRVSNQAQLALLDHGIDGNNIKQMQEAKNALQMYLIDR